MEFGRNMLRCCGFQGCVVVLVAVVVVVVVVVLAVRSMTCFKSSCQRTTDLLSGMMISRRS